MMNIAPHQNETWFNIGHDVIFIDDNGNCIGVPGNIQIERFYFVNPNRYKSSNKYFYSLKDLIQYLIRITKNRKGYFYYAIRVEVLNLEHQEKQSYGILHFSKNSNQYILSNQDFVWSELDFQNTLVDTESYKFLRSHLSYLVPESWYPNERTTELKSLEVDLMSHSFIKNIIFRAQHKKENKINFLKQSKIYFEIMNQFLDLDKIPSVNLVLGQSQKWSGYYSWVEREIILKPHYIEALFHEYFHHIDHQMIVHDPSEDSDYNRLVKALESTKTIEQFHSQHRFLLDTNGNFKSSKTLNSKLGQHYLYWLEADELTARFFEDYVRFFYSECSDAVHEHYFWKRFEYTQEEFLSIYPLLEQVLRKIGILKKAQ